MILLYMIVSLVPNISTLSNKDFIFIWEQYVVSWYLAFGWLWFEIAKFRMAWFGLTRLRIDLFVLKRHEGCRHSCLRLYSALYLQNRWRSWTTYTHILYIYIASKYLATARCQSIFIDFFLLHNFFFRNFVCRFLFSFIFYPVFLLYYLFLFNANYYISDSG